eukprot:6177372-Pleurochrysis_carterae.AAC.1
MHCDFLLLSEVTQGGNLCTGATLPASYFESHTVWFALLSSCPPHGSYVASSSHRRFLILAFRCLARRTEQERRRFGAPGFSGCYDFDETELEISVRSVDAIRISHRSPPLTQLTYLVGSVYYAGLVTDQWDLRCLQAVLATAVCEQASDPADSSLLSHSQRAFAAFGGGGSLTGDVQDLAPPTQLFRVDDVRDFVLRRFTLEDSAAAFGMLEQSMQFRMEIEADQVPSMHRTALLLRPTECSTFCLHLI